jgi:hypothetical protein
MANYNPFAEKNQDQKPEGNWFMKTAIKAAAFTGTAFGVYGLWKMTGPSRKILEKAIDSRMQKAIAQEQYKIGDHYSEYIDEWKAGESSIKSDLKRPNGMDPFDVDVNTAWKNLNTEEATKTNISSMEDKIIRRLEEDATYLSPDAKQIKYIQPGHKFNDSDWFALNKKKTVFRRKTVSLSGFEAEQLARLRQSAIVEYLETYGAASVEKDIAGKLEQAELDVEFFSSKDYFDTDHIKDGYGKEAIDRVTTVHNSYINDKAYSDIYKRKLTKLHRRYVLESHSHKRARIDKPETVNTGGGYRKSLYGDIFGEVIDPSSLETFDPTSIPLFDGKSASMKLRSQITSMGATAWAPSNRFSILQQTVYTGHIENLNKTLKTLQQERYIADFSIDLVDYGTAAMPDKRLRVMLIHPEKQGDFKVEIPIGIDGRLPGATPGLQQLAERYHIVGDTYGRNNITELNIINTTEMNLRDFARMLKGSMMKSGIDSFKDNPMQFIKQANNNIMENLKQNAPSTGGFYDLLNAMTIDNPALRDLIDSSRTRHHRTVANVHNFITSARNTKKIASLKKIGKKGVIVSFDMETLDGTKASVGKSLLSQDAQIVKYGITAQDTSTGRILHSYEESNTTGYKHYQEGGGEKWNTKLRDWLRKSVLPDGNTQVGREPEAYLELLKKEGAKDYQDRREVVKSMGDRLLTTLREFAKDNDINDVFIGVKNGFNFDLKAFEMDYPGFFDNVIKGRKVRDMIIDVQSLHTFRNNALGENNALNIESVVKAMMSRATGTAEDTLDINKYNTDTEAGLKNIFSALQKHAQSAYQRGDVPLLNFDFHGKDMVMKAHGSPRVDSALTSALIMDQVASYMAGTDYLDAADYMANLLKRFSNGPASPDSLLQIFRELNEKVLKGYGVASFSSSSSGMIHNLVANLIHVNELMALADPANSSARRRFAGKYNISASNYYLKKYEKGQASNLFKPRLGRFMSTNSVEEGEQIILDKMFPKATDAKNQFSNSILSRGIYFIESEAEPTIELSMDLMKSYKVTETLTITTDSLSGDSLINNKILDFHNKVSAKAKEISKGGKPSREQWALAEKQIAAKDDWGIKFSEDILSANKYGGEVALPQIGDHGRITSVIVEPDKTTLGKRSVQRLIAKISYDLEGQRMFRNAQLQAGAAHGVAHAGVFSSAAAAGYLGLKDIGFLASSEFLKKGHVGAAKEMMLSHLIKKLYADIEGAADPQTKRRSEKLLKEVSERLKATPDIKGDKFIVNTTGRKGEVSERVRILGDTDVSIKMIGEWYRTAGLVWNKSEVNHLYDLGYKFEQHKQFEQTFKEITKLTDKELLGTYSALKGLSKEELSLAREELAGFQHLFSFNAEDPSQSIKMFLPVMTGKAKQGKGLFRLGMAAYDSISIYGSDAKEANSRTSVFRQDYYLGLRHTYHGQNQSTMDYLARHTFGSREQAYRSVQASYRAFADAMFSEQLTKAPMNITQIAKLTNLEQRIKDSRAHKEVKKGKVWGDLSADKAASAIIDRDLLLEKKAHITNPLEKKLIEEEIRELNELLSTKKGGKKLFQNASRMKKFYSTDDVMDMSRLARENNGIVAFELPSLAGVKVNQIDIRETVRRFVGEITGQRDLTTGEITNITNKLVFTLEDKLKGAKKDSPFRMENGILHMGALVMDWDPLPGNAFTKLRSSGAWLSNEQTEMKMNVLRALTDLDTVIKKAKEDAKGGFASSVEAARDRFSRTYVTYLMMGMPADTTSKFWQSGQFAPEGLNLMLKNLDNIQRNIITLESNRPGGFSKEAATAFNKIKEARFNTAIISEKAFKNFNYVTDSGERVNAAREIEKSLIERYGAKNGKNMYNDYTQGRKVLPGGLVYRHPIPQAGYDGMKVAQFVVVPDHIGRMIGVDQNSLFANPIFAKAMGGDFDGDHLFVHLKEIGAIKNNIVKYTMGEMAESDQADYNKAIALPQVQKMLREGQITRDEKGNLTRKVKIGDVNTVMYHSEGHSFVATYDMRGNRRYEKVEAGMLDLKSFAKHTMGFLEKLATQSATHANKARISQVSEAAANTLISKNLIPITTNLLKKRVKDLISLRNPNDNPLAIMMFMGNIEHGLAGAAQSVIDIAKHPENAAKLSKVVDWLTTGKQTTEAKDYFMDLGREALGERFDEKLQEASFDIMSGRLEKIETLAKASSQFDITRRQDLDMYMGRKGANIWDGISNYVDRHFSDILQPTRKLSAMEQINDALSTRFGKSIDLSPAFKKGGKFAAIGAAAFLGLSLFTPFGTSKSLNPVDMFIDIGDIDGNHSVIDSPLELPRSTGLATVNASFSKEAFIKMNKSNRKKDQSGVINSMLMNSMLTRGDSFYEFKSSGRSNYSNYTKAITTIGTNELNRKYGQ